MTFQELIDRARTYVDDDHNDTEGWIKPERWLSIANVEYAQLYRRWVRMGLIAPAYIQTAFTGPSTTLTGVLCIIGVAEDLGGGLMRPVPGAQSENGRNPWWSTQSSGPAFGWKATGAADNLLITIEPGDTTPNRYVVRHIPTVAYATSLSSSIDVPYGCDERLVLGIARRAKLKDASASALLERLIQDADTEANFLAFGRMNDDSPRVRRVPRYVSRAVEAFPRTPSLYRFI